MLPIFLHLTLSFIMTTPINTFWNINFRSIHQKVSMLALQNITLSQSLESVLKMQPICRKVSPLDFLMCIAQAIAFLAFQQSPSEEFVEWCQLLCFKLLSWRKKERNVEKVASAPWRFFFLFGVSLVNKVLEESFIILWKCRLFRDERQLYFFKQSLCCNKETCDCFRNNFWWVWRAEEKSKL